MPPRICKHTPSSNNNNLKKPCLNPPLLTLLFLFQMICFATSALILTMRNHHNNNQNQHKTPMLHANQSSCSLFVGSWIRDSPNYPLYDYSNCQFIDPDFNCQLYGRPDSDYLRYRWQPLNCDLPRFNGVEFLTKMRGKTVMLVGDSLGRNQYESLVCMIASGVPHSSIQSSKGLPLSTVKFLEYGVTVSYYKAPYLVDIDVYAGKKVLRLDEISGNANAWRDVDVLLFNTGHWWTHVGASQGWQYMESGGSYYQDMDRMVAMEKALKTWSKWVDSNIDSSTTRLFFLSISPTHDNPSEWTAGATTTTSKNCYGETAPMNSGTTYPQTYTDQMRIIDAVITNMHTPVYLLDITMLSGLRKDCHPSIYSGELNPQQRVNPGRSDCSHWCLPGLPDTWNQLLYTAMFY